MNVALRVAELSPHRIVLMVTMLGTVLTASAGGVRAQYTTIIESPPTIITQFDRILSDTQINLHDGGTTPSGLDLGRGTLTPNNIQLNVYGGVVGGGLDVYRGSEVNLYRGAIQNQLTAHDGSTINIFDGTVGTFFVAKAGSAVNLFGGTMSGLTAESGSVLNIAGGRVNALIAASRTLSLSGGSIGDDFRYSGDLINTGGSIGQRFRYSSGTLNMSGGKLDYLATVDNRGVLNLSGGSIYNRLQLVNGSTLNASGGSFGDFLSVDAGSTLNLTGGVQGDSIFVVAGGAVSISGNDFRVDGNSVTGLETLGASIPFTVPEGSTFTGTLSDGTPFAFTSRENQHFPAGTLTLHSTAIPAIIPATIDAATDIVPLGIRGDQTLLVPAGSIVGENFTAGPGSRVVISGGSVGRNLEAIGSHVTIVDGNINYGLDAFRGAVVDIAGGMVGGDGGSFVGGYVEAFDGGTINISGGTIQDEFTVYAGGIVNLLGGSLGDKFVAKAGSAINISGNEFRLNGALISGLEVHGSRVTIDLPENGVLSGVLADGTPFASSSVDDDSFAYGTLGLTASALPSVAPTVFHAPGDSLPRSIREGQTLMVAEGGQVPNQFSADRGSRVVMTGGRLGKDFEAAGAEIVISGGSVDSDGLKNGLTAWHSTLDISGGEFDSPFAIADNSVAHISDGNFERQVNLDHSILHLSGGVIEHLYADNQSVVNVSGGFVDVVATASTVNLSAGRSRIFAREGSTVNVTGGKVDYEFSVRDGSVAHISGGQIEGGADIRADGIAIITGGMIGNSFSAFGDSQVEIAGGTFGDDFNIQTGAQVEFTGNDFRVDGEPVAGLETNGSTVGINVPSGSVFSGTLADGTPFAFTSRELESDDIADGTVTLRAATVATGAASYRVPVDTAPLGVHNGQTLVLADGGVLGDNFGAGHGSAVHISGGMAGATSKPSERACRSAVERSIKDSMPFAAARCASPAARSAADSRRIKTAT